MPMSDEVRKAVEAADAAAQLAPDDSVGVAQWQTIRAELTRLTEIADAVDPLVIRLGEVTTRLEAANALLRECVHFIDYGGAADDDLAERIEAHLSENGHD